MVEKEQFHQPQLPMEDEKSEEKQTYNPTDRESDRHKEIGHIIIDDTEQGGLSERDRLAIPIDEEGKPVGIRNPELYANSLVSSPMGGEALLNKYKKLLNSKKAEDQELAKALEKTERVQGLLKEEYTGY